MTLEPESLIQIKQLSQQYACNITKDLTNLMANLEEDKETS